MKRVEVETYKADIYVGYDGRCTTPESICGAFCDSAGLCVTVEHLRYVFTGGECPGVRVGLINYGRFPATPDAIFAKAEVLALRLIEGLGQESASIVATDRTVWLSRRAADVAPESPDLSAG